MSTTPTEYCWQWLKIQKNENIYMKHAYFDLSVENLKEARQFFENIFGWRFEKMSLPFEYYRIQAGDPDGP